MNGIVPAARANRWMPCLAVFAAGALLVLGGCTATARSEPQPTVLGSVSSGDDAADNVALPVPKPSSPRPAQLALADPEVVESQVGLASWYGRRFHGRLTASGSQFDMAELTAAHLSLPFGSRVRVTNLANGRSVVVTINDRGPYVKRRVIDVSRAAAQRLGFLNDGLARVRLDILAAPTG